MKSKLLVALTATLLILGAVSSWASGSKEAAKTDKKPLIGFITNGPYEFWTYSASAVDVLKKELNIDIEFLLPPNGLPEEQKRFIESLVARGVNGIGMSVTDPDNSTPFLNEVMQKVPMVFFDSDAPKSNRLAYVGMSNYATGRMAGQAIREVLPNGGNFMIIVGRLDAQNAIERRQGIIDELNGMAYKPQFSGEMTPNTPNIMLGGKWNLLETRTDGGDQSKAKSNAEDAILKFPQMDLMVGMWSYSSPAIISAVSDAGLLGKMKIIGFDMENELLQAVKDGNAYAAFGQDPFTYAVKTIEILAKVARGEDPQIPADKLVDVPAIKITQKNIDEVWAKYKAQLADGKKYLDSVAQ
jgi:ribose transport system substrate-binding protein